MPRPEKVQAVADIKERIENARAVFLAEYAGLSVAQQQTLRRELKANGAEFKVIKMTLARRAAAELDIDTLDEHLLGPTGIAIADDDVVAAAKVIKDFANANEVFKVKGGLLGLDYLSPERVSELAEIEPRDVLLAKLAGVFSAPMANVAGVLSGLQQNVVGLVQALVDKREAAGETPEATAEEPVAEVAPDEATEDEAAEDEASDDAAPEDAAPEDAADDGEAAEAPAAADASADASASEADESDADESEADAADESTDDGDAENTNDDDQADEAEEE